MFSIKKIVILSIICISEIYAQTNVLEYKINYSKNKLKASEGYLFENKKIGKWLFYYSNQNIWKIIFYNIDTSIYSNASIINIDSLSRLNNISKSVFSYEEKVNKKMQDEDNIRIIGSVEIPIFEYYQNGRIKAQAEIKNFLDEKITYYTYYKNKNIASKEIYYNSSLNGFASYYFKNGKIDFEGNYIDSMHDGIWNYYDTMGRIIKSNQYKNDTIIK